jgi:hypothetical protein
VSDKDAALKAEILTSNRRTRRAAKRVARDFDERPDVFLARAQAAIASELTAQGCDVDGAWLVPSAEAQRHA